MLQRLQAKQKMIFKKLPVIAIHTPDRQFHIVIQILSMLQPYDSGVRRTHRQTSLNA